MALISVIENFRPLNNARLLERANELMPYLRHGIVEPIGGFRLRARYSPEMENIDLLKIPELPIGKGENLCLDFGNHYVGYLTLYLSYQGSHPDAPAFIKLKFAETLGELSENSSEYDGWISSSWIQEEYIHLDVLPAEVKLPRRYAFRYMKITMLDTSPKYKLIIRHAECKTQTSADYSRVTPFLTDDQELDRIYQVSLHTLENCMQKEFEDGPKRDRRLWMGDFRLQALVNSVTFRNFELVKRCLYLFAGSRFEDGRISACLFTSPTPEADDTYLFDYALLYVVALEEYLRETDDLEALRDLYDIAMEQIEYAIRSCTDNGVVNRQAVENTFIDWAEGLEKGACAQAVLIYSLKFALSLAERKGDDDRRLWLQEQTALLGR